VLRTCAIRILTGLYMICLWRLRPPPGGKSCREWIPPESFRICRTRRQMRIGSLWVWMCRRQMRIGSLWVQMRMPPNADRKPLGVDTHAAKCGSEASGCRCVCRQMRIENIALSIILTVTITSKKEEKT